MWTGILFFERHTSNMIEFRCGSTIGTSSRIVFNNNNERREKKIYSSHRRPGYAARYCLCDIGKVNKICHNEGIAFTLINIIRCCSPSFISYTFYETDAHQMKSGVERKKETEHVSVIFPPLSLSLSVKHQIHVFVPNMPLCTCRRSLCVCYAGKMVDFLVAAEMQNTNAETEKQEISAYFQPQQMLYYFFVVVAFFTLCLTLFRYRMWEKIPYHFVPPIAHRIRLCFTHTLALSISHWMSNMKVELHDDGNDDDNIRLMIVCASIFLSFMFDPSCDYYVQLCSLISFQWSPNFHTTWIFFTLIDFFQPTFLVLFFLACQYYQH